MYSLNKAWVPIENIYLKEMNLKEIFFFWIGDFIDKYISDKITIWL